MIEGDQWRLIECRLAPELVRKRIENRAARKEGLSDANWEIFLRQYKESAGIIDSLDSKSIALDTGDNLSVTTRKAPDWLRP